MQLVLGVLFVVYGVGMPAWGLARGEDISLTSYALYGFLAIVGVALLIKTVRDRRRSRRNR